MSKIALLIAAALLAPASAASLNPKKLPEALKAASLNPKNIPETPGAAPLNPKKLPEALKAASLNPKNIPETPGAAPLNPKEVPGAPRAAPLNPEEVPEAPGAADLITELPGLPAELEGQLLQYSGYLDGGSGRRLHYWFVESQNSPSDDPLLL